MGSNVINPYQQYVDDNDVPLAAGSIQFYTNRTTTASTIYSDDALSVEQANPYPLDSIGRIIGDVKYAGKMTLEIRNSLGGIVRTDDDVETGSGGGSVASLFALMSSSQDDGNTITVNNFYAESLGGGGTYYYKSDQNKNTANGGTIIDPGTLNGWDGTQATIAATYHHTSSGQGNGVGNGCWMRIYDGAIRDSWFGTVFDGASDDVVAMQATLDAGGHIMFSEGTCVMSAGLTKSGQFWTIEGSGPQLTILKFDLGTYDLMTFDNSASAINRATLKNFMIQSSGDKAAGASFKFTGSITNCVFENLYGRVFWDLFEIPSCAKSYFTNITYDQFGRTAGTRGRYGFNCTAADGRMVDWHLNNIQGSGFVTGASPLTSMDAHFNIVAVDGMYMENFHFFYADRVLRLVPDDVASKGDTCASVHWTNGYCDTTYINHVFFGGTASVAYKKFFFTNIQFREAETGDSISFGQTGDVDYVHFTGCISDANYGSGIEASNSPDNVLHLNVTGCTFRNNNSGNNATSGDVITRGNSGVFTSNIHDNGGAAGHCYQFLSGSNDNICKNNNLKDSTCTVKISDGGSNTQLGGLLDFNLKNNGTATINNPSVTTSVTHGLALTPSAADIKASFTTASAGVTKFWVDNATSTTFDITVDATPTSSAQFLWSADMED